MPKIYPKEYILFYSAKEFQCKAGTTEYTWEGKVYNSFIGTFEPSYHSGRIGAMAMIALGVAALIGIIVTELLLCRLGIEMIWRLNLKKRKKLK